MSVIKREEALEKIAWEELKKSGRDDAVYIISEFFKAPIHPRLKDKLNITVVAQHASRNIPDELNPGNPIYRPILLDSMTNRFRGATNEYLAHYLRQAGVEVTKVEGDLPYWLPCPVCNYKTFLELGTWKTCAVCGWNSDSMQEALPDEPIGSNDVSLNQARKNFTEFGAITREKLSEVEPDGKQKYPPADG